MCLNIEQNTHRGRKRHTHICTQGHTDIDIHICTYRHTHTDIHTTIYTGTYTHIHSYTETHTHRLHTRF